MTACRQVRTFLDLSTLSGYKFETHCFKIKLLNDKTVWKLIILSVEFLQSCRLHFEFTHNTFYSVFRESANLTKLQQNFCLWRSEAFLSLLSKECTRELRSCYSKTMNYKNLVSFITFSNIIKLQDKAFKRGLIIVVAYINKFCS